MSVSLHSVNACWSALLQSVSQQQLTSHPLPVKSHVQPVIQKFTPVTKDYVLLQLNTAFNYRRVPKVAALKSNSYLKVTVP